MESQTQTQTQTQALGLGHGHGLGDHRFAPRLRPKPSSGKLRSAATQSTVITSNRLQPPPFNRSRTDLSVPHSSNPNNAPLVADPSAFGRRVVDRRRGGLPTPVERSSTPTQRPRAGPPTKDHRVFSAGSLNKVPSSVGSSGASSDKSDVEQRRRLTKKKSSAPASDKSYSLRNSSSGSLSTTTSSHFGSRTTSQSSVLGITLPATSASSQASLHVRQRSGSITRLLTQDLPVPLSCSRVSCDTSSPSTRYTDSPFSHSSTPSSSSSSSHSPGPAAMLRALSSSPSRPPVTRQRTGSFAGAECSEGLAVGLDPVRESTTSTSSGSTVRAAGTNRSRSDSKASTDQLSPPPAATPRLPRLAPSPQLVPSSKAVAAATGAARPMKGGSASAITPRPSKEGAALGPSIPGTMFSSGNGPLLAKTQSRSITTTLSQGFHKDKATPPLPSPGITPTTAQRAVPRSIAQGFTYNTIPPLRGTGSKDSAVAPKQTTPAITKPGIFSRGRTKSEDKVVEKPAKRGPAAGTGYEGYGTFGKASRSRSGGAAGVGRDRSGSQSSTTSSNRERSGSTGSRGSVEMDDYLAERLKPVVIAGGEVVENHNRPTEMVRSGSSPAILEGTPATRQGRELQRSGSSLAVFSRGGSPPSPAELETVAARRINVPGRSVTPIPPPISTSGFRIRPAPSPAGSVDSARKLSVESSDLVTPASSKPRAKRWIFFPKSQPKAVAAASPPTVAAVPLVPRAATRRNVPAHYALLDQDEQREAREMVERMHELRQQRAVSGEVSEPPKATADPPHVLRKQPPIGHIKQKSAQAAATGKPTGQTLLPPYRSFLERSRSTKADGKKLEKEPASANPELRVRTEMPPLSPEEQVFSAPASTGGVGAQAFEQLTTPSPEEFQINWKAYGLTPTNAPSGAEKNKDFWEYDPLDPRGRRTAQPAPLDLDTPTAATSIAWPPRSDSISSAIVTQTVEVPAQEEEETHEEFYSELEGMYGIPPTPAAATFAPAIRRTNTVRSTTSSLGSPFQYADLCSPLQLEFDLPEAEQRDEQQHEDEEEDSFEYDNYSPDSPTLPPAIPPRQTPDDIPILSHSHSSALGPSPDQPLPFTPTSQTLLPPSTPFSVSSFIRYYDETDEQREGAANMVEPVKHQLDSPKVFPPKTHRSTDSSGSTATTRSTASTIVVEDEMKIRPWALIASRWLSFDRVLVSPAHQALTSGNGGRVLVVDGLGTGKAPALSAKLWLCISANIPIADDWSFYCALSYPSAKVYNLSQSSPFPPPMGSAPPVSPSVPRPPNHHQVHYPSFATPFPFPKGFFDVICFRFLPSSSDAHWAFILSQCKRVLRPGGHLEVTLLDADLMNVGPRTQRAVDLVKAIMQRESEAVGSSAVPRPASEKVLRILSKKGFEDINKCFVGLPAVGKVGSSGGAAAERDIAEREHSPEDPDDINEVVSKVGRWWYSRCYEGVITARGEHMERSMWADRALLRECRKRHTNFRMLVCCARKPIKGEVKE